MTEKASFDALVAAALAQPGRTHMRPVLEKELLHYDILFALDAGGFLKHLVFQGGTCLRLAYGAPRFSEDLDFAGGYDFDARVLDDVKRCLEDYLGTRYGLLVEVKSPRRVPVVEQQLTGRQAIKVAKWQIAIQTAPGRRDLPRQRIKLEVANIPAYTRTIRAVVRNYVFLPDGYSDVLLNVESLDEIMADKLVALPSSGRYIRHRDVWDLLWLQQQGAELAIDLVQAKLDDYRLAGFEGNLRSMINRLPDITRSAGFKTEIARFLPQDVQKRTILADGFDAHLAAAVANILADVDRVLYGPPALFEPFRI